MPIGTRSLTVAARQRIRQSAGVRVIYFFVTVPGTIFFADIYAKNENSTPTAYDKKTLKKLATAIKGGIS